MESITFYTVLSHFNNIFVFNVFIYVYIAWSVAFYVIDGVYCKDNYYDNAVILES